jgi:hypothetical protein
LNFGPQNYVSRLFTLFTSFYNSTTATAGDFQYIDLGNAITRIRAGERFHVQPSEQLTQQVQELIGKNTVFVSVA